MSLFVCSKCHCIENTALCSYHSRKRVELFNWIGLEEYKGKALCSECGPLLYRDGTPTRLGKWHGKFPKQHIDDIPEKEKKNLINYER